MGITNNAQAANNELSGLAALNNNGTFGLVVRTANGAYTTRALTGTANQVTVTNGNGVAGNQTASLPNPLNVTDLGAANLNVTGTLKGTSAMLGPLNNSLVANVALSNTSAYFDGPSISQGTNGTWFATGTVTLKPGGGAQDRYQVKLWDGTTIIASAEATSPIGDLISVSLSGFISSPAGNIRMSSKDISSTSGNMIFNNTGSGKDSTITAFRIG